MSAQPAIRLHDFDSPAQPSAAAVEERNLRKTKWYRENAPKLHQIEVTGLRAWQIIKFLERIAVTSSNYADIAEAVKIAELFREQTAATDAPQAYQP